MRQETLCLLTSRFADTIVKLSWVLVRCSAILTGFLKALLCALVIFLEKLERGFERVQDHLILLYVHIFGRDGVLAQVGTEQYTE